MTRRAEEIVDKLLAERVCGARLSPQKMASILRASGLRPSEAGWVLHHVQGLEMAEAVHVATLAGARVAAETTIASGVWPRCHAGL